ncbi:MAG: NADH-quinone oxidoreductase subunit NuoG [Actinomycetota bacterium]|nr:NADH-quinone oxidoreductase subunit NuoG [Actinomycetota bacterium]
MASDDPQEKTVTLTIDGKGLTVPADTLIIRAAEQVGVEIPRFCDHPLLDPVGACRQCYVEVEGQRKLFTSCTTVVADGMVVKTQNTSELVHEAQVANLEFLLLNHPLDCPICDRGGECPLQDQALAFGPGESRYREAKRVYPKPLPLSPLVNLDRERCVLCARCTRFCDQISGDRFIELFARGAAEQVSIAPGEDFRSPFSGNTVQICPVGALTSTPYRFAARPFDLSTVDTVCPHCSAGCNIRLDMRRGEIVRQLARDNYDVNDAWLCDKGRYSFGFPDAPARITTPLIRDHGLEPASFGEVLTRVAEWTAGKRVAMLTGGRLMDEDYYALSKLARTVFRTNDLDHRRGGDTGAGEAERHAAASPMTVTYKDVERAEAILVVGLDAEQEVPILHLRLRKAARRGARIWVLHPRRTRLHDVAAHVLCLPGDEARLLAGGVDPAIDEALTALREAGEDAIVLAGERHGAADAAKTAADVTGARYQYVTRRANDRGALIAGVHPALLPGGRTMQQVDEVEQVWGPLMNREPGRDTMGVLRACADGEVDVLFLIGVDPLRDVPDAELVRRALDNVPVKVVQSLELGSLEHFADAFLPASAFLEKEGHVSTWEGRGQRIRPIRGRDGISLADWEIFASMALACGGDLGFETLDELHEEMSRVLGVREVLAGTGDVGAPTAAAGSVVPAGEGLVLFTYPLLVDEGRLSEGAEELKAALEDEAFVEIHPLDAAPLGLVEGGLAVVGTDAGEVELPVRITEHVVEGSVFVPFNQPAFPTNTLLSGRMLARARLSGRETAEAAGAGEQGAAGEPAAATAAGGGA